MYLYFIIKLHNLFVSYKFIFNITKIFIFCKILKLPKNILVILLYLNLKYLNNLCLLYTYLARLSTFDLCNIILSCLKAFARQFSLSNTQIDGKNIFQKAQINMFGHELKFEDALKYQSPMRKTISENPERTTFMADLKSDMDYHAINKKWAKKPTIKLLFQKYIWGNRQKISFWNLRKRG